ncbi:MAG: CtsR family transcriptional regulator [Synergistaceae bacterium]|nr:CtsR family transcriptional regulator [Synergistaceae bacterium]
MRNLSHNIEQYILNRLDGEEENFVSLRRKDLAEMFECVPSQINYVLRSRFSPEQGYIIESRRGEHGYIKIVKISCVTPEEKVEHTSDLIGKSISLHEASRLLEYLEDRELITQRERLLIEIALRHSSRIWEDETNNRREEMFADLLKRMLKGLMLIKDEKKTRRERIISL